MVIFAVLALNVFHPGMCMREGYHVQVSAPRGKNISGSNSDSELGGNVFMLERMGSASVRGGGKVVV